jgi:hypothetical protein
MSKWIAAILAFSLAMPAAALAAYDPTNSADSDRQIYKTMLDRFAGEHSLCVVQKANDFAPYIRKVGNREFLRDNVDWYRAVGTRADLVSVDAEWRTLIGALHEPVVGHYVSPDLLLPNMRLVDDPRSCAEPSVVLSAPAFTARTAFIRVEYLCVLCGNGSTYALLRIDGRWQVVAVLNHWVS